ncbi:MAG: transposase [Oceanospirillaceae bacterium]|uniref:transposase n=1 Tax=unclassified Thalassolituus TaxID=2624967 RepID=UPI000C61E55F|nr:transposase [Oceanospirillaceae bacterium]MBL33987.1 transposase [Oceanospirillaceae bacterium]MBS54212.1 transposase [Oceanospirillaceae bacterium]|tara:strand:- start:127 stop:1131 length:1005 start_codon:yes stop_codon:yes gene_type:complete
MPKPRKELISLEATPYYHCVSRCVRRAFLCGSDEYGRNFEHRRGWIENLILEQAQIYAVDIAAYAVMSNHFHVVLHINQSKAESWSAREVIERWHQLYKGTLWSHKYLEGDELSEPEKDLVSDYVSKWRERLMSVSWFMRRLNETIARMANEEDDCTGHFWEGRFKSQALLDEKALAACMAYVDLNPVRASMAKTPETSDFTSIKKRSLKAKKASSPNHPFQQIQELLNFAGNPRQEMPDGIHMRLTDYIELVDWTGKQIREGKRGKIESNLPPALIRLDIDQEHWLYMTQNFESEFKGLVGSAYELKAKVKHFCNGKSRFRTVGLRSCQKLLS